MQVVDWIARQAARLADNFNSYNFHLAHTPAHALDSSTLLTLTAYTDRSQHALVPCRFRWSRIKNGIVSEAEEFKGSSFICEPSDVGSIIQAEVTSTDQEHAGTAVVKYGPVELDVVLQETLLSSLGRGESQFAVDLCRNGATRSCLLTISNDVIRVGHANSSLTCMFPYSLSEPIFQTYPKDPNKLVISFGQKFEKDINKFLRSIFENFREGEDLMLEMRFLSRKQKDEYLFTMKAFNAKRELKNSAIINKIEKMVVNEENINFLLEIQSLRSDLLRLFAVNHRLRDQKRIYYEESRKLEQEMEEIISSYAKLIESKFRNQFQSSYADFESKRDRALVHKYEKMEEENQRLKEYIRTKVDEQAKDTSMKMIGIEAITPIKNPFLKKKIAYGEIKIEENFERLLDNLSRDEEMFGQQKRLQQDLLNEKEALQIQLNMAQNKIMKLQKQIDEMLPANKLVFEHNKQDSHNHSRSSALEISTNKILQEKLNLETKYLKLMDQNSELRKTLLSRQQFSPQKLDDSQQMFKKYLNDKSSPLQFDQNDNPESREETVHQNIKLRQLVSELQIKKNHWKAKADELHRELTTSKQDYERVKAKLQAKITDLMQELIMARRNNDVLNRSQHLSMDLEDYNYQQAEVLKEQNAFLLTETERLAKMCQRYKGEYKKLKTIAKQKAQKAE